MENVFLRIYGNDDAKNKFKNATIFQNPMKPTVLSKIEVRIYSLSDFDGNVFYVGCTTQGLNKRLGGHLSSAKRQRFSNNKHYKKIISLDYMVKINQLDSIDVIASHSQQAALNAAWLEEVWINRHVLNGIELTNRLRRTCQKV